LASKHEQILLEVIKKWSVEKRGRLFKMMQGTFRALHSDKIIRVSPYPGKINGFPDLTGFEFITYQKYENWQYKEVRVPVFCMIEVKTKKYSKLTQEQKDHLNYCVQIGGKAYVARENDSDEDYELREWKGE